MRYLLVFVSNYINHHQIPFCNVLYQMLGERFCFIQTEEMEAERIQLGWNGADLPEYVICSYREPEECRKRILESRVVLFGGVDEEAYIAPRLEAGLPVIRYAERPYKTGQWKMISPRGLRKKYHDHTRYRKAPVYLLCAGAYVASDYHLFGAYPGKMFRWGYFPEVKEYDVEQLLQQKGSMQGMPYLFWAARMIDWKHPQIPVRLAAKLKAAGLKFRLEMAGTGPLEEEIRELVKNLQVEDCVHLIGSHTPQEIRRKMEQADIYLVTSDRQEGWGAVVNEAMNSACAVVGNHMIGAVPTLIDPENNGRIYHDKDEEMLYRLVKELLERPELARRLGRKAYETMTGLWNPRTAAKRLVGLMIRLGILEKEALRSEDQSLEVGPFEEGPGSPAPVIGEYAMRRRLNKRAEMNSHKEINMTKDRKPHDNE